MVWTLITVFALAAIIAWWVWARYTRGVEAGDVARFVQEFAEYSAPGGVLEVRQEGSRRMLQFARREESQGTGLVEFGLPEMSWSQDYFREILKQIETAGFTCIVEEGPRYASVRRFLHVIYGANGEDLAKETRTLLAICNRVMGFTSSDSFKIRFRGVVSDEAIERVKAARR
jgi:hypothetical protein